MGGNISLFYAAKVLANEEPRLDVLLSTKEEEEDDDKENGETTEKRKKGRKLKYGTSNVSESSSRRTTSLRFRSKSRSFPSASPRSFEVQA